MTPQLIRSAKDDVTILLCAWAIRPVLHSGIILAMNTYLTDPRGDVEKFEQLLSKLDSRTENKLDKLAQLEQEDAGEYCQWERAK